MQRNVTMKDLAKELGVSVTTVSKALNGHPDISEARRKEIVDFARKKNYFPDQIAKSIRTRNTRLIGVIMTDNSNPFNARMLRGIEETLSLENYQCIFVNTNDSPEKERQIIMELLGLKVDGIIICPAAGGDDNISVLKNFGTPFVQVSRYVDENEPYVVLNDKKAGWIATSYLCEYEYPEIFFFNSLKDISTSKNRLDGYKQALEDHGIKYNPELVKYGCRTEDDGYIVMNEMLKEQNNQFAVLCFSDIVAIGAMAAVQERNVRMPYDVALCGIDNINIVSFIKPRLTTVGVPKKRMGVKSAEVLINMIKNGGIHDDASRIMMEPEFIIQETA